MLFDNLYICIIEMFEFILKYVQFDYVGTVVFFCISLLSIWYIKDTFNNNLRLPPGPWGLPFLGYLPWIAKPSPHASYISLAEKYGHIYSIRLGTKLIVCVSSADILRHMFNRQESISRPDTPLNKLMNGYGIVLSDGVLWRRQRLFLNTKIRSLGASLSGNNERLEKCILIEVHELLKDLVATEEKAYDPAHEIGRHIHNVICSLMMSHRFKAGDEKFNEFNKRIHYAMKLYGQLFLSEYIPAYVYLPGKRKIINEISVIHRHVSAFNDDIVVKRIKERATKCRPIQPVDLLDHYLDEIEKSSKARKRSFADANERQQLLQVMNDLFSAGMETSRSTILWMLIIMVHEPVIAGRVRGELDSVVASDDPVLLRHRPQLVYTEAVILETLRRLYVVPLGTTHVNTENWNINGYSIPAGTQIIPLINKIHMDPNIYEEPDKFKPERFIDSNGELSYGKSYLPFGIGRRICLGENIARMELFLFFANIMKHFSLSLPKGCEMPSLQGILGTTHMPYPFKLKFKVNKGIPKLNWNL